MKGILFEIHKKMVFSFSPLNAMKSFLNFVFLFFIICSTRTIFAQLTEDQYRAQYRENQITLDQEYSGVGLDFSRPNFGKQVVTDGRWMGIDLVSNILHLNYSVGKTKMGFEGFDKKLDTSFAFLPHTGQNLSIGLNVPLPIGIGQQQSYARVLRLNPVVGFDVGAYKFWEGDKKIGFIGYASLNAGLRLRVPFGAIEAGWRFRAGVQSLDYLDSYKSSGIDSYITLRLDGLKPVLNPNMVTFSARQGEIKRMESIRVSNSRYLGGGVYQISSKTYTFVDVEVHSTTLGFQDIGPFFGVGPRIGFNSQRSSYFSDRGRLYGVAAQARASVVSVGLNFEGGRIGHASVMEVKGSNFTRKVDKSQNFAMGSNRVFNTFLDVGFDISDMLLSLSLIEVDRDYGVTSFFSVSVGYSMGFSIVSQHVYNTDADIAKLVEFESKFTGFGNGVYKPHELGGANGRSGYLGGWYFAAEVGAMQMRVQWYKYYRAPLLNNFVFSMTYRLPVWHLFNP